MHLLILEKCHCVFPTHLSEPEAGARLHGLVLVDFSWSTLSAFGANYGLLFP